MIASMNAHLPLGNRTIIMFDTLLSCFKKDQRSETVFLKKKKNSSCVNNTTHTCTMKPTQILPNLKESLCNRAKTLYRKQESVMTRRKICHTWYSYLLKKKDQPFCPFPVSVKHIRMLRFYSYQK